MQQLHHENIVQYFGSENTGQALNIFMEYVPGGSISSLLQRFTKFSESVVCAFARQILQGLRYIHSCNMVHRGTSCLPSIHPSIRSFVRSFSRADGHGGAFVCRY